MREIKFRGKRVDNGEWVYGSLLQSEIAANGYAKCEIHERFADDSSIARHEVIPESVGQYTGLKDKNGKEVYEGGVVRYAVKKRLCPKCSAKEITSHFELSNIGSYCPSCGTQSTYEDFITVAEVVYHKAAFGYQHYPDKDYYQYWPVYANEIYIAWVEVIGNIYESPELINK